MQLYHHRYICFVTVHIYTRTDIRHTQDTTRGSAINQLSVTTPVALTVVKWKTTFMIYSIKLQVFIELLKYTHSVALCQFCRHTKQHQNKVIIISKQYSDVISTDKTGVQVHIDYSDNLPLRLAVTALGVWIRKPNTCCVQGKVKLSCYMPRRHRGQA
jgi:hypothetical protein